MFQAKVLCSMDESNPNPAAFNELRSAAELALHATKMIVQVIGRSIASLVVLKSHMWLNLTEMKNADNVPFLDSLVSRTVLFGPAAAQKSSQAMRHFRPKHSSSAAASSFPKMAISGQAKATPPAVQPAAKPELLSHSRSARRHPPKCQGLRPKIVLDPAPQASS